MDFPLSPSHGACLLPFALSSSSHTLGLFPVVVLPPSLECPPCSGPIAKSCTRGPHLILPAVPHSSSYNFIPILHPAQKGPVFA